MAALWEISSGNYAYGVAYPGGCGFGFNAASVTGLSPGFTVKWG